MLVGYSNIKHCPGILLEQKQNAIFTWKFASLYMIPLRAMGKWNLSRNFGLLFWSDWTNLIREVQIPTSMWVLNAWHHQFLCRMKLRRWKGTLKLRFWSLPLMCGYDVTFSSDVHVQVNVYLKLPITDSSWKLTVAFKVVTWILVFRVFASQRREQRAPVFNMKATISIQACVSYMNSAEMWARQHAAPHVLKGSFPWITCHKYKYMSRG